MAREDVIIVGAGLAGIAAGVQLKRQYPGITFEIFDKLAHVGGTWAQNTYPNLSCDVDSQYYSYSFYLNPNWTETFARQPEILNYIENAVEHFQLGPYIKLNQECLTASWTEENSAWNVQFRDRTTGKDYNRECRVLITAAGVFTVPKGREDVPILQGFQGDVMHTSNWRDTEWQGKKVLVLGNGCSANQVVPWLLQEGHVDKLVQIVRSEQWVAPKVSYRHSDVFKWSVTSFENLNRPLV
ncbi:MAG: hypothetical protein Q9163_003666 [Psora crenata]